MSSSSTTQSRSSDPDWSHAHIHQEQRRIGHICAILVRNLSLRPTRDRALQTLTSTRPGGSSRYHTTSDDADLTLSLARSNSKGKGKVDHPHRRRRSTSWSRLAVGSSDEDEEGDQLVTNAASTSAPTQSRIDGRSDNRGRPSLLANRRRTSDHELTSTSTIGSTADGRTSAEASPRPILKRSSSTRTGRDARTQDGFPGSGSTSGFLEEFGANTTMLSRSDSRSSSHSSHTIRRPSHRARTASMTSSHSVRSVRFDESHLGGADEVKRPSRISGRLNAASRYMPFSQKSLSQIMKDRMLECYVELELDNDDAAASARYATARDVKGSASSGAAFYRTPSSHPGLHHSWGYQGGDPITPERDFTTSSGGAAETAPLEASTVRIKVWARSPMQAAASSTAQSSSSAKEKGESEWKLVCQTRVDLRDLEPIPGNLQNACLSLPPNSILLGLAPGANSLSGRASLGVPAFESHSEPGSAATDEAKKSQPKLARKSSEREAERTRHVLESIIYYAVPLEGSVTRQDAGDEAAGNRHPKAELGLGKKDGQGGVSPGRLPKLRRRASGEEYASDPENATSRKRLPAPTPTELSEAQDPASRSSPATTAITPVAATTATTEARRRERRKAFEDEQRRVLELSLRETKMMPSYSLDEARQLSSKQAELQSLLAEVEELRYETGARLQDPKGHIQLRLKREQQQARCQSVRQLAIEEASDLTRKKAELEERTANLEARRKASRDSKVLFEAAEASARKLRDQVQALEAEKLDLSLHIHAQQASLLRDLETIFPIELSDASSLLFSICGLPLPNSVASLTPNELTHEEKRWKETVKRHVPASSRPIFHPFDDDTVSSAFGLVAQLVVLLSTYLATPIHYPLATAGSRAVVQDGISLMSGPRAFPLYAKGMERYRYEYAAFLLNKDIEQLMNVHSVTVIDIRHTLPNLKNLIVTVAAAPPTSHLTRKSHIGKKEIPLRSVSTSSPLARQDSGETAASSGDGGVKPGLGLGLGLPNLEAAANKFVKTGALPAPDTLVTTRVLGASSKPTATPATASGAIASVSRALSYFSGSGTR